MVIFSSELYVHFLLYLSGVVDGCGHPFTSTGLARLLVLNAQRARPLKYAGVPGPLESLKGTVSVLTLGRISRRIRSMGSTREFSEYLFS